MPPNLTASAFMERLDALQSDVEELLEEDIHKALGGWVRDAGRSDRRRLLDFLDAHAATMPRTALRYAIEHLDKPQREHYLGLKKGLPTSPKLRRVT